MAIYYGSSQRVAKLGSAVRIPRILTGYAYLSFLFCSLSSDPVFPPSATDQSPEKLHYDQLARGGAGSLGYPSNPRVSQP